ncbi:MAG: Gfo/Idh/MocA family oxidoreductase [Planctomycetia bacterium]|nr:Gfo/Idh/MocA family oxidoreductase [Planctomycetia bacterium]
MPADSSRRDFLKLSAGVFAATGLESAGALAGNGANDTLVVGLIGCGGRGKHDAGLFKNTPNVEVAWACDVDDSRRQKAATDLGVRADRSVADMRRVLDNKSVDAVIVTTPDHWHSPAAILACDAGKHVYVEKPISHNVREGRLLVQASERNKRLVQHGTQVRSTSMIAEAVKLLHSGAIGTVLVAKCWNVQRRGNIGHQRPGQPPAGLDYDNWVGPALSVPYQENRCHSGWHWWYDFGTGDMGNDGVHDIDYTRWGLGVETHPNRIVALGGKFHFDDDQQFPDTQQVTFEYAGDGKPGSQRLLIYEQRLWSTNYPYNVDSGAEFYGTDGQMFLSRRGKVEIRGGRNAKTDVTIPAEPQNDVAHVKNFCDAVRKGAPLNASALIGHLTSSLCHLGNVATRLGRSLAFNPNTEQIIGDDQANALLGREYRDHWGRPKT